MIDVLMNGAYTFGVLETLYQNFSRPGASIKVNGMNIVGVPGFKVTDITVHQTISDKAGSATFNLVDCYDRVMHCFSKLIDKVMVLGAKVEVALGYSSVYLTVFKGYIAEISWNFDAENGASCSVSCLDARGLMLEDHAYKRYGPGSFTSVMESIVKPYRSLCSLDKDSMIADSVEGTISPSNGQSIYQFIKEKLVDRGAIKKEFFVLGENLYYRTARKQLLPIMSIGLGTGLLSFSRSARYLNKEIEVIGQDAEQEKSVKFSTKVESSEKQSNVYKTSHTIIGPHIKSKEEAVKEAMRKAVVEMQKKTEGSGTCIGLPQIVPGRFIYITGLDDHVNGLQYITEATHKLSMSGYTTDITIGGE